MTRAAPSLGRWAGGLLGEGMSMAAHLGPASRADLVGGPEMLWPASRCHAPFLYFSNVHLRHFLWKWTGHNFLLDVL